MERDFNFEWKFTHLPLGTDQSLTLDDRQWRDIRLPHDWSIEAPYSQENTAGATGYLPGGEGWYRKQFTTPVLASGRPAKTQVLFDGVYNHSEVWINGHSLGKRPFGYAPFYHDLTPHLKTDGSQNLLTVYVDRARYVDSRWYPGSGIYRNVKLITSDQVHLPIWGTTIKTPEVTTEQASVVVEVTVQNDSTQAQMLDIGVTIENASGDIVAAPSVIVDVPAKQAGSIAETLVVAEPRLWDIDSPNLYVAKLELRRGGTLLDSTDERFGIRDFKNDPDEGFSLNGRNLKIKGVNLHHEAGLVGAAVPKGVWQRRLEILKEAGVNAIRTAHNPASNEFLELCDEMGFLVQEEAFDEWDNAKDKRRNFYKRGEVDYIEQGYNLDFAEWAERDLKAMLMRDKNHPSIFQWSIGNEIEWSDPKYPAATGYWDENRKPVASTRREPPISPEQSKTLFASLAPVSNELAETAAKLAAWTREIDTTRPITANLVTPSVSHHSGYVDALDIAGYSYRQGVYDYGHRHYPDKMIMGTENWIQWHEWKAILDRHFIPGIFVWTGIDYLGEADGRWPNKGASAGMLDFAAYPKAGYHMLKTLWDERTHIHISTQALEATDYKLDGEQVIEKNLDHWKRGTWGWRNYVNEHWNYDEGQMVVVEVYTNLEKVELLQDGKSLGVQSLADHADHILRWAVPFKPGVLEAKSAVSGVVLTQTLHTAGEPAAIVLSIDNAQIQADSYDVAHVTAQIVDNNGVAVKHQNSEVRFVVDEKLRRLGVDNGSSKNIQPHQSDVITSHKGRALLIVQSKDLIGLASVKVTADGMQSSELQLELTAAITE